jgi:hypothetical protein
MKLSQVKNQLDHVGQVRFRLPDGTYVPEHFHITEVGSVSKHFIDCGGTVRTENVANFQLWQATDYDHRLSPQKLKGIIELSERILNLEDREVEVEYQSGTIGKYALEFQNGDFVLTNTFTDCLAKDNCGIPTEKKKLSLAEVGKAEEGCCTPGSGCC